ncbi:MAG: 3-phosphoshikimate 1-carboxyvinyltransferase [Bacteroidia bacterium]|nr:MAG: 3-phosphoshikimate 1-carboxyvinyltransferase [Bacteroidia bacterium]
MKKRILPSGVSGLLQAPPSKSVAQRAIAMAAMADGVSEIGHPGNCDDVIAAIDVCKTLGAEIRRQGENLLIRGGLRLPDAPLFCGESGLGMRMFAGLAASFSDKVMLTGTGSLLKRPMQAVVDSLTPLGVSCTTSEGYPPVMVKGPLKGGEATIDGTSGSQILTGILMASPFAMSDTFLTVNGLKSKPYIDLTLEVMRAFGVEANNNNYESFFIRSGQQYRACRFRVEGDWSGAAFMLVAGAIAGKVTLTGLNPLSVQADKKITEALKLAGARLVQGSDNITTEKTDMKGFSFDATDAPDLFPPLVSLAAHCSGTSRIKGIHRLRTKESDRAATLMETFGRIGITITSEADYMIVHGGRVHPAVIHSHGDHRIAMAGAVAALAGSGEVHIEGAEAVNKSYPGFFKDLEKISTL